EGYQADGNCRLCLCEIEGENRLQPSCKRQVRHGDVVSFKSERVAKAVSGVMELLIADQPVRQSGPDPASLLWQQADRLGIATSRYPATMEASAADLSHPAMAVNLAACIHCTNCLRACREEQMQDVIGMAARGAKARIVFDQADDMGASSCVGCGECVQSCPTGALMPKGVTAKTSDRQVDSLCPYCGVGCQLTFHLKDQTISHVSGRQGPANLGRLCVKGRFGFDYVHSDQRLTKPLIRIEGAPKDPSLQADPREQFREASWEEALALATKGFRDIKSDHGSGALAGFGSAKGSNEEAYLFQKLIRTGFGTNNVDHCTRLCHASSVAALMEGVGSG
ncbi:MAG: molybdopterin-dependent oxidoreductase, partial [Alphaproteobacteria bacterium]